jgi:RHH-type proline utilization regulon transcriptional repressor/proline dehydrogenase/delta 1-pyrroline-5-carboxylate dehydrogenase
MSDPLPTMPPPAARLPYPYRDEREVLGRLGASLQQSLRWPDVMADARPWVRAVRDKPAPFWALESLLREYPI